MEEVPEKDKQPEKEWLSPNNARLGLPVYDLNTPPKSQPRVNLPRLEDIPTVSREEARSHFGLDESKFQADQDDAAKNLADFVSDWDASTDQFFKTMPENDWRSIPGFAHYQMNGLGAVRGTESKMERPTYVKLWCGGDDEVVIGVDALRAMTFGVTDA